MDINKLYSAIMAAEHQGFLGKEGYNPWIRTKATGTGSSAFGPVQLTGGKGSMMANVAGGYSDVGASPEEIEWIKSRYLPQASNFLKYGGDDMQEGMERFDYGGTGDFTDKDKSMYESVAKKIMQSEYDRTGGAKDINKFIQSWRGKSYEEDPEYYDFIKEQTMMNNILSEQGSEAF
tara:strand:+ start:2007 stop:2537 length:531 start_codon:yes stop_codon:yes gene_type:complete